jgi:hypothetical protein
MRTKNSFRPRLEMLEDRWVPANVHFINGGLYISPSSGEAGLNLTATQSSANHFTLKDGAATLGTFGPVSNLYITGGNGADTITVNLNALTYTGNLLFNTGNGNDSVAVSNGSLLGNLTGLTGAGNDTVSLGGAAAFNVGGTTQLTDTLGSNTLVVGGAAASSFGGDFNATGYNLVTLGNAASTTTFNGNITINDGFIGIGANIAVNKVTANKSLNISTGSGADTITFAGANTVNGSTSVNTGAGNDSVSFTGTASLNGNVSVTMGDGNDSIAATAGTIAVGGNLSLTLGNGNDTISVTPATNTVAGDLSVTLGSGADSVTVDATVSGSMSWNLGNGNDTVTIGNAPGGKLNWISGNGNDSVTFGDATNSAGEFWNVNMQFGTGNDTLTLAGNGTVASPEQLGGFIDMGGPPGGNSFDPTGSLAAGTWVIVSPFTLQNV